MMRRLLLPILPLLLFLTTTANAADSKELKFFDVYAAPTFGYSSGSYNVDSIDDGSFYLWQAGVRMGVKAGPLLLGIDAISGNSYATSANSTTSETNRIKYTALDKANLTACGLNAGITLGRLSIWGSYYLLDQIKVGATRNTVTYQNIYDGKGSIVEADVRLTDHLSIGYYFTTHTYNQYQTSHSSVSTQKVEELNPTLKTTSYGVSLSYLFPFSELKKFQK